MKKQILLILLPFLFCVNELTAQTAQAPIVIQSGSTVKIAPTLDSAVSLATNGDVLYLPGGTFSLTNPLSKRLSFIGTGWRSDSSTAMGSTNILNTLDLSPLSSGTYLSGIYFSGTVQLSIGYDPISFNLDIERCRIGGLNTNTFSSSRGLIKLTECVIGNIGGFSGSLVASNCIIERSVAGSRNGNLSFTYCIFLDNNGGGGAMMDILVQQE